MLTRVFYPSATSTSSPDTSEIDLRAEFDTLIFGDSGHIPHGREFLLRKMRRDSDGELLPCVCRDSLTGEAGTERSCPYCLGEGYYWDESWITGYTTFVGSDGGLGSRVTFLRPGSLRADTRVFYFRYDTVINYSDKIVELQLDTEGDPIVPYKREAIYKPQTIVRHRSDRGRVEYIAVFCNENDAIRPEPVYG